MLDSLNTVTAPGCRCICPASGKVVARILFPLRPPKGAYGGIHLGRFAALGSAVRLEEREAITLPDLRAELARVREAMGVSASEET